MSRFVSGVAAPAGARDAYYVCLSSEGLLTGPDPIWAPMELATWRFAGLLPRQQHFIGFYNDTPTYAMELAADSHLPPGYHWQSVRSLLAGAALGEAEFCAVSCGMQVFHWDRDHQYCSRCGAATRSHPLERARVCEACDVNYYPRLSPCVIMLVTRGEECLLARHSRSPSGFFSALAGFIEPGESAEGALHREVYEEVGLRVGSLRYYGSQPWPFPGQLMLGFHAAYHSGEIRLDDEEISDARWFHYRDLPSVPPGGTLSGQLIHAFVEQLGDKG